MLITFAYGRLCVIVLDWKQNSLQLQNYEITLSGHWDTVGTRGNCFFFVFFYQNVDARKEIC